MRSISFAIAAAIMAFGQQAAAQAEDAVQQLIRQDMRLAAIAEPLLQANSQFCRLRMPLTGMVLHSRDQYRSSIADGAFSNGTIAVAGVVPGSPADAAGIRSGDGVVSIGAARAVDMVPRDGAPLRDTALAILANAADDDGLSLSLARDGREVSVTLNPPEGCRALVEIRASDSLAARSDGRVIQIDYALAEVASEQELAVVFAHELAHLVLEHRRRLEAAGVEKGFFGEFGKNQRLNRQVEVEADRMSVHLLANAGYDPAIAPAFWRSSLGRRAGGGVLRSSTYPSPEARAQLLEREIAEYLGGGTGPTHPGHLLSRREAPFD